MYDPQTVAANIKRIAKMRNLQLKDVLIECGLSKNAMSSMLCGGSMPKSENLAKIADVLKCSVDELLGRKQEPEHDLVHISQNKVRMIPVFASISAGVGVYANSEVLRYEPVYIENDYDAENALCIMVKGDSMYPKIEDGDIILVVKDIDYADGEIVAVMDDQDNGFVKKIYSFQDKLILRSINPEYQDMVFVREEMNAIKVVGVVKKVIKNV